MFAIQRALRSWNLAPSRADADARLRDSDRKRYLEEVAWLERKLAESVPPSAASIDPEAVWLVYARTEKLIAVLKFAIGFETPGVFVKLPTVKDQAATLGEAKDFLTAAGGELGAGKVTDSIVTLRKARNNLRAYLTDRRKSELRVERASRRS